MKYLILTQPSIEYAELVSQCIWIARYPEEVRLGGEQTQYYCGYIVHPSSGDIALVFPDEPLVVHPMRKLQPLVDTIKAPLPEEEKQNIQDHFDGLFPRETALYIDDALPPIFASNLKTREQMESAGWFNSGEL